MRKMPADVGARFGGDVEDLIADRWPAWVDDTRDGRNHEPGLVGHLSLQVLEALPTRKGIAPEGAEILVRPGLVRGTKARRHKRRGDALSSGDWKDLPRLIARPSAVLWDERNGTVIYLLPGSERRPQIAIEINAPIKRGPIGNSVVSAYKPRLPDIRGRLKGKLLTLLIGEVK